MSAAGGTGGVISVHAFDFDGTLTRRDSLPAFCAYAAGCGRFIAALVRESPAIIAMYLGKMPAGAAKERLFSHLFAGMDAAEFSARCADFARTHQRLLRRRGMDAVRRAAEGGRVLIVSASAEDWVRPFFAGIPGVEVTGTRLEADADGRLTGRFLGANCKGEEKVRRIMERFGARETYHLTAYGDSAGDREMLAFADEARFCPFHGRLSAALRRISPAEALRFVLVGGVATAVQYVAYRLFLRVAGTGAAFTLGYLVSLAVNFVLSTLFTFRVRPSARRAAGFVLSHAVNYSLQAGLLHLLIFAGLDRRIAPIPVYAVCVPVNFLLVRFFLKGRRALAAGPAHKEADA